MSNASFITITSGSSGSGNGTVNYSVAANTGTTSRTGTMTIAGRTFTVTQAGTTGGGTELISNAGFEKRHRAVGRSPARPSAAPAAFPHSGVAYMIINGVNSTSGTLYQTVDDPERQVAQPQLLAEYHHQRGGGRDSL